MGLAGCSGVKSSSDGWRPLFNGKDLTGWKASEKPGCFSVENGAIKVSNGRSHLFYIGDGTNADFTNFEFSAQIMTTPGSNSGIYFHTEYQENGWPEKGYECQVNQTHSDPKKSGSLYDAKNVLEQNARDNQWYTQEIIVNGKNVIIKIDGKIISNYTEADNVNFQGWPGRKLSKGTFAIQGHDPKSIAYFKNIKIRELAIKD